jgi:hypothetical protein
MNCQELNTIEGLKFIPIRKNKVPIPKEWQKSQVKHDLSNCPGVGLVCGELSGSLEAIDCDCKYDLTGKLFENYKRLIHELDKELLQKLVVQKTRNNGYHFIYRCSVIAGNLKLANRPTTDDEKRDTYNQEYKNALLKNPDDTKAKQVADKISKSDKVRVLIETRGEGGYIACYPTDGYQLIHGDFYGINEITVEQRDLLHGIARQFNQVYDEVVIPKKDALPKISGLSPFEDYNQRGDVVSLLQEHGWKVVSQKGSKTVFLRPGQTSSQTSGNYDRGKNWFSVFTTSTDFEPQHAYLPYAVFAVLECNKNFSEASKKLYDLGFGDRLEQKTEKEKAPSTRVIQSRVDPEKEDFSLFATSEDYDSYLEAVRDGTLKMGLTTGSPALDAHFVLKEGAFVHINGIDNVGKSEIIWWMLLLAAMYHGWKGVIFSSENTLGAFMRRMIQFYWGKPLSGNNVMSQSEYEIAKKFIEKHFLLIKSQEDLYNYKDIINLAKIAQKKGDYQYGMIDPYNSLKIDLSGYSKLNTHEYHYEALSELKSYGQKNKFGWFITHHAVTAALRLKDADKKYPVAPRKEDTEQGGKVANKADDFLTIHRITQHPTDWMISEIHVRKIKDTETGGRPTILELPIRFERYKGGYAYVEVDEFKVRGIDPVEEWHKKNGTAQDLNFYVEPKINQTWQPFKDSTDIGF